LIQVASVSVMLVITITTIITITYGDRGMVGAVAAERVPIPKEPGTLQHRTGTAWRGGAVTGDSGDSGILSRSSTVTHANLESSFTVTTVTRHPRFMRPWST
jgi:hypothetical protein